MLQQLENTLSTMKTKYNQGIGAQEQIQKEHDQKEADLLQAQYDIATWEKVQKLYSLSSDFARQQLKVRIEETVSAGMQSIFMNADTFKVDMSEYRDQPAAKWKVHVDGGQDVDPEEADGGGLSDVVSTTLRLSILETARPKLEGIVTLDEPGKMVSGQSSGSEYLPNMAQFLKEYTRQAGRQLIMITHEEQLMEIADVSYRMDDKGQLREVKRDG